jgi:hypothetical protein
MCGGTDCWSCGPAQGYGPLDESGEPIEPDNDEPAEPDDDESEDA